MVGNEVCSTQSCDRVKVSQSALGLGDRRMEVACSALAYRENAVMAICRHEMSDGSGAQGHWRGP